jgi:hypothetical protein
LHFGQGLFEEVEAVAVQFPLAGKRVIRKRVVWRLSLGVCWFLFVHGGDDLGMCFNEFTV